MSVWRRLPLLILLLGLALSGLSMRASSAGAELVPQAQGQTHFVFLPFVSKQPPWLTVDTQNRDASRTFFHTVYRASEGIPINWTGSHATCDKGTTANAFRNAMELRINYFRAMAGIPADVKLAIDYTDKAQQAALMMSANGQLSHTPTDCWTCYSPEGTEAASKSNLYLGVYGIAAIDGYMRDPGTTNTFVGHRRRILYPQTRWMGTGDIPPVAGYPSANVLWVFDDNFFSPRPPTREPYVAWPPPGYVPYQVVYPRWSWGYPGADFSSATVSMSLNGQPISVVQHPPVYRFADNTLVWEPAIQCGVAPVADLRYRVTLQGVLIDGQLRRFDYDVIVFDPQ